MSRQQKWRLLVDTTILWAVFFTLMLVGKLSGFPKAAEWIGYVVMILANAIPVMLIDWWLAKPDEGGESNAPDDRQA